MAWRLHSRLVVVNIAAIAISTLIVGSFLFGGSLRRTFESEIEQQLSHSAALAEAYIRAHNGTADPEELAVGIANLLNVRVTIIASDGKVLGDSDVSQDSLAVVANHSDRPEVIGALRSGEGSAIRSSATLGPPFIYVARKLADGRILRLAQPMSSLESLVGGLRRQLALAILVCTAMTFVFGYLVYVLVSHPLHRLAQAAQTLAAGNLDSEIPVSGDRDLMLVGSALNLMAGNLKHKIDELEDDKTRTNAIIAAMSAGVVVFDTAPRVILSNQSAPLLLDSPANLAGRSPLELLRSPEIDSIVHDALAGHDIPAVEVTTGSGRILLAKAAPVAAASGQIEMAVMVLHDLTEIRRSEKMRREFVANVSHEFKTPLTSIRGFTETLIGALPDDPHLTHEFLEAIERNCILLQAMVDNLMVLARLESDTPPQKDRLNVRRLTNDLVRMHRHQLESRRIHVEVDCEAVEILADGERLSRAFTNLLDNAVRYNHDEGSICITGRTVGEGFSLSVADTGDGIPREDLARIFERFYRVAKARDRSSGGTGLGLAIAKHAIESQGGTLSVTSRLGEGSTFTIVLPL